MTTSEDILRHVRLETGHELRTWDTDRPRLHHGRPDGRTRIGYELTGPDGATIFSGDNFFGSSCHADDSDDTLRALLGFLTLRPGDTDREYFDGYSAAQWAFVEEYAEHLAAMYWDGGPGEFAEVPRARLPMREPKGK